MILIILILDDDLNDDDDDDDYDDDDDDEPPSINYNADPITNSESFKYKSCIRGKTSNGNNGTEQGNTKTRKNLETVLPLKYLSYFWRSLVISLINCAVSLTLTGSENYVLTDITTQDARAAQRDNPARPTIRDATSEIFKITDTQLYVPVATLLTKYDNNF